jgi:hypothetical protein
MSTSKYLHQFFCFLLLIMAGIFQGTILFATDNGHDIIYQTSIATTDSLFQSDDPLEIIIETDLKSILTDKSAEPEYQPGKLIQRLENQSTILFDIKIKARGHSRRNKATCSFPPLKINFKQSQTPNTVFKGQDKLKLVTHCKDKEEYEDLVLKEYLAYKMYNVFTDYSYRVRLVQILYRDSELNIPPVVQYGFFIEHDDRLAKRMGAKKLKARIFHHDSCEVGIMHTMAMYQYMIGNTDWWVHTEHNIELLKSASDEIIPVPFDFDLSGAVNAPYARPDVKLPIHTVRDRFYKGPQNNAEGLMEVIYLYNSKKEELMTLLDTFEHMDKYEIKGLRKYIDRFYNTINNPAKRDEEFNGENWAKYFMNIQ